MSPTPACGERRGEVALILVLTPESKTLHLKCLLQDIIQAHTGTAKSARQERPTTLRTDTEAYRGH